MTSFGLEGEACDDRLQREQWDRRTMEGRAKIFEVRKIYNDYRFVDEFLTQDVCDALKLPFPKGIRFDFSACRGGFTGVRCMEERT